MRYYSNYKYFHSVHLYCYMVHALNDPPFVILLLYVTNGGILDVSIFAFFLSILLLYIVPNDAVFGVLIPVTNDDIFSLPILSFFVSIDTVSIMVDLEYLSLY